MKQNDANINEHNKMNSIFSRIYLVPCDSSMLFDDGEVHCRVYDPWLSWIYKQTIVWKWTGLLKILQYRYPYLDPYAKQIKVHLTLLRASCYKTGKLAKKSWRIVVIRQSFFPSKVFYCTVAKLFYFVVAGYFVLVFCCSYFVLC